MYGGKKKKMEAYNIGKVKAKHTRLNLYNACQTVFLAARPRSHIMKGARDCVHGGTVFQAIDSSYRLSVLTFETCARIYGNDLRTTLRCYLTSCNIFRTIRKNRLKVIRRAADYILIQYKRLLVRYIEIVLIYSTVFRRKLPNIILCAFVAVVALAFRTTKIRARG